MYGTYPYGIYPDVLFAWEQEYGPLPETYCVTDSETDGLNTDVCLPVEIGWCGVKNRKAAICGAVVVDWPGIMTATELDAFSGRMTKTAAAMQSRGNYYPWTVPLLREKGTSPEDAVNRLAAMGLFDGPVLAHYGWFFDFPLYQRAFEKYTSRKFEPAVNNCYDTCLMVKAGLLGLPPRHGEPISDYYARIDATRGAPKHNLAACVDRFHLVKLGGVSKSALHSAGEDCYTVHLLFERLRSVTHPPKEAACA